MKNPILKKGIATAAGLATVIALSAAAAPALAKGNHNSNSGSHSSSHSNSASASHSSKPLKGKAQTVAQAFTVTNVPAIYSAAAELRKVVDFKVVVLPADATVAPAVAPSVSKEGRSRAVKNLFDPSHQSMAAVLADSTLSGNIVLKAARTAGVTNLAIYPIVRADAKTGLAAQTGTPVFVIRTTAADGTVSLSGLSGPVTIDLGLNTGTILAPQVATVVVPDDGKSYALDIINADGKIVRVIAITGVGSVAVTLPRLKPGAYTVDLVVKSASGSFTIGTDGALTTPLTLG